MPGDSLNGFTDALRRDGGIQWLHVRHEEAAAFAATAEATLTGELRPALEAAFEHDGPALVDVLTRRQELSVPPHVTFSEMKGVSLFAGRTILSGRGDELVELARENLR